MLFVKAILLLAEQYLSTFIPIITQVSLFSNQYIAALLLHIISHHINSHKEIQIRKMGPLLQTFLLTISFICFAVGFDLPANEVYKISLSKNQESQEYNTIASLFFDNELKSWKVQTTDRNPNLQDGKYCISLLSGNEDQIIKPCFNYRHVSIDFLCL